MSGLPPRRWLCRSVRMAVSFPVVWRLGLKKPLCLCLARQGWVFAVGELTLFKTFLLTHWKGTCSFVYIWIFYRGVQFKYVEPASLFETLGMRAMTTTLWFPQVYCCILRDPIYSSGFILSKCMMMVWNISFKDREGWGQVRQWGWVWCRAYSITSTATHSRSHYDVILFHFNVGFSCIEVAVSPPIWSNPISFHPPCHMI